MHGLVEGKGILNTALIAKYYGQWFADDPFDIGSTVKAGLKGIDLENPSAKSAVHAA